MRRPLVFGVLIFGALSFARNALAQSSFPGASPSGPSPSALPKATRDAAPTSTRAAANQVPKPAPRAVAVRLTLSPEWGYRSFVDREPNSADKLYTAPGILGAAARLELYPLALITPAPEVGRDFGITVGYSRAIGLESRDIDTDSDVATQWYQFNFGARFRILGGDNPLSLGFTAGIQRWVYEFDDVPASRLVANGTYTILPVGVDARYAWGAFSVFADARFLLPVSIARLGDRAPTGARLGASGALGAAFAFSRFFEVEMRGAYTLLTFSLPPVAGRPDKPGSVLDQYLVFSAGATFRY